MRINNNILIGGLLAVVFLLAVGYATFATQLRIGGMADITAHWDVHIKSITAGTPVGSASVKEQPFVGFDKLSATFSTVLQKPGDSLTYTVVVENDGNLDALLSDIIFNKDNNECIDFTNDGIAKNDKLKSGKPPLLPSKLFIKMLQ